MKEDMEEQWGDKALCSGGGVGGVAEAARGAFPTLGAPYADRRGCVRKSDANGPIEVTRYCAIWIWIRIYIVTHPACCTKTGTEHDRNFAERVLFGRL